MKHETNGKSNWEQFIFTAVVAGAGIDRFEEEFAQYEKDLEEAKKEQGKA